MNAPAPKTSPDAALGNLMAAALDVPAAPEQPAVPDDTLARTGNTARDQEMYAAGIRTGEENAKHNAAIRAAAGWLPIESAPKDGRRVLLWNERYNAAITGQFYGLGGWKLDGEMPPLFHQPTHWMPLPTAPGVSTVQDKPAAYLTLDEDGSPCMLFFDVVEARAFCEIGEEPEALWRRPAPAAGDAQTDAARDVLFERKRQQEVEGFDNEHDDHYTSGDLAMAGATYAINAAANISAFRWCTKDDAAPDEWPWPNRWWKPSTTRRDLVKAGALILAEIERLDRAAQRKDA